MTTTPPPMPAPAFKIKYHPSSGQYVDRLIDIGHHDEIWGYTQKEMQARDAQWQQHITALEADRKMLREALKAIEALENTETNEWDCVERVMPEMAEIARNALRNTHD